MIRRFGFGLNILLLLAVLAGVITFWVVISETPAEKLGQKIHSPPTPEYHKKLEWPCDLGYPASWDGSMCYEVFETNFIHDDSSTKLARDEAEQLALITDDFGGRRYGGYGREYPVVRLDFYHRYPHTSQRQRIATSYCFNSKVVALSALRGELRHAELLGKTDSCYVALYRGNGQHNLNPWYDVAF